MYTLSLGPPTQSCTRWHLAGLRRVQDEAAVVGNLRPQQPIVPQILDGGVGAPSFVHQEAEEVDEIPEMSPKMQVVVRVSGEVQECGIMV